jgi:hypothetical protein
VPGFAGVVGIALSLCGAPDRPLVAEVHYDASGDDTEREFVELFNPGVVPVSLDGVRLEAGDGAGEDRWTTRWTGSAGDSIGPGARFVVGGAEVLPAPDALATLALQNGPDAVRIVWSDGVLEVVGWGGHAFAGYACGDPALDGPSGYSLARIPDDGRAGSNAIDFVPALPSPGRANRTGRDVALEAGSLAASPERPEPARPLLVRGVVWNLGLEDASPGALALEAAVAGAPFEASVVVQRPLAAGESLHLEIALPGLPPGRHRLIARVRFEGDEVSGNDRDSLDLRVGPGPLEITELQFHPERGEGEWVEVVNRSGAPLDPAAFVLSDRGEHPGTPQAGSGGLPAESLAVLVQYRAEFLARFPGATASRVWEVRPWSSLNNANGADGFADAVVLREAGGVLSDRVDYSSTGVPSGVPLERRHGGWWPSLRAEGTPLAPPVEPSPLSGTFRLAPRRLAAGTGVATLSWDLPWPRAIASLEVYDMAGRLVARPWGVFEVPARGERGWSTSGLPPGVYVVVFDAAAPDRSERRVVTEALRVVGDAR